MIDRFHFHFLCTSELACSRSSCRATEAAADYRVLATVFPACHELLGEISASTPFLTDRTSSGIYAWFFSGLEERPVSQNEPAASKDSGSERSRGIKPQVISEDSPRIACQGAALPSPLWRPPKPTPQVGEKFQRHRLERGPSAVSCNGL